MSVQSEINRIATNIANAYTEAETLGATMPATENSENLASTIATIPTGGGGTDVSDTTAIASDVRSGKYFYIANGTKTLGTAVPATATVSGTKLTLTDGFPVNIGVLEHVGSLTKKTWKLSATDYDTWTPSTTAKSIIPSVSAGTFTATDVDVNDYFSKIKIYVDIQYNSGTSTAKGMFSKCIAENWYCISRRVSNLTNLNAGTRNYNVADSVTNYWYIYYYNTSWTVGAGSQYGFYTGNSAPTLSSTSATSPTVTVMTPLVNARCNASYFSTTMAGAVDKNASTVTMTFDYYKVKGGYTRQMVYNDLNDMWANGI